MTFTLAHPAHASSEVSLAVDLVGQTVWDAATLCLSSKSPSATWSFPVPPGREAIYLHVRSQLSAPPARYRVPIEVSPFYTTALGVELPAKVATGEQVPIKISLPKEADSDGMVR